MKTENNRIHKLVATVLCTVMILSSTGCAYSAYPAKNVNSLPESSIPGTTLAETTKETTTDTSTSSETSISEGVETTEASTETSVETNSESSATSEPAESTETVSFSSETDMTQQTKDSKKETTKDTKKSIGTSTQKTKAPSSTTRGTKAPSETSEPTVHTYFPPTSTPTPSPSPTPTGIPYYPLDVAKLKSVANSAIRQAIMDKCGGHKYTVTNDNGEDVEYAFQFDAEVMARQQKRSDCALANGELTHGPLGGYTHPDAESICSLLATFSRGGKPNGWVYQGWPKNSEDYWEDYTDFYTCIYNTAYMLVTVHCKSLSTNDSYIYYGYGFSIRPVSEDMSGMDCPRYDMMIYIGAQSCELHGK